MRYAGRAAGAGVVGLLAVLAVAALGRVPYTSARAEDAILRLSWRTRGEEVRECRTLSPEELAALPVHMQRTEVCEGRALSRHLLVSVDGRSLVDDTVRAAGARGDRPLYVYYEIPLPPGAHALHVRFVPEVIPPSSRVHAHDDADERGEEEDADDADDAGDADDGDRDGDKDEHGDDDDDGVDDDDDDAPRLLELQALLDMKPGEVTLITYDSDRRELVARTPSPRGSR